MARFIVDTNTWKKGDAEKVAQFLSDMLNSGECKEVGDTHIVYTIDEGCTNQFYLNGYLNQLSNTQIKKFIEILKEDYGWEEGEGEFHDDTELKDLDFEEGPEYNF